MARSHNEIDKQAFLRKLRQGDEGAFREWMRQTRPTVEAVLGAMIRDPGTVADLAQQAYIRAYTNMRSVRRLERLGPWITQIAKNVARDHLRRQVVRQREFDTFRRSAPLWAEPGDAGGQDANRRDRVRQLVDELPEEQREVILLRYYANKSYDDIAQLLGVPLTTVDGRMRQARRKLAEWLRADTAEGSP